MTIKEQWMGILSNATVEFIISTSLTFLLGGINVWFVMRRSVQIPLTHETLLQQRVDSSNEEVRDLFSLFGQVDSLGPSLSARTLVDLLNRLSWSYSII